MNGDVRENYLSKVLVGGKCYERDKRQEKALEYAHKIRQFEIELFWKRSAYFWVFIALAFYAYSGLVELQIASKNNPLIGIAFIALSFIGLVLSFLWWLSNKGSRYWQEVWENNIDFLEDEITGKLYKRYIEKSSPPRGIVSAAASKVLSAEPFSVSKISIAVSFLSMIIWSVLLVFSFVIFFAFPSFDSFLSDLKVDLGFCVAFGVGLFILILTLLILYLLCYCLKSDHASKDNRKISLSDKYVLHIRSLDEQIPNDKEELT